jgi:hypothetical protein
MKKEYKYIRLVEKPSKDGYNTKAFYVANKKSGIKLGMIEWYQPCRQYCFISDDRSVFPPGSLVEIVEFITALKRGKMVRDPQKRLDGNNKLTPNIQNTQMAKKTD